MIEKILFDYLNAELDVPCCLERPAYCPEAWVLLERTGGSKTNYLSTATMAVQSYAPSLYGAASLNRTVKAAMERAVDLTNVFSVRLNSDYNYSNQSFKGYRYQAVFNITYKE